MKRLIPLFVFAAALLSVAAFPPYSAKTILSDTAWDDLRFPASGINPPGVASDPARSVITGLLEFSATADNIIAGVAQMPHSWKPGSAVEPHIHIRCLTATTAVSRWKLEWDVASPNNNFGGAYGTYPNSNTVSFTNPNNTLRHTLLDLGSITMTGHTESANIVWRLSRLASSDAADVDTSVIVLLDLDFHYQVEKVGTDNEIPGT